MSAFLRCRVGAVIVGDLVYNEADWPIAKLMLTQEGVYIQSWLWSYQLAWTEIDWIEEVLFGARIRLHVASTPPLIRLSGWNLFQRLKEAVHRRGLAVRFRVRRNI